MKGDIYKTKYGWQVRFGRKLTKHFKSKEKAERFLNYIRVQTDNGEFDLRDWQKDKPLSFEVQAIKWLELKRVQTSKGHWNNLHRYMSQAIEVWKDRNVKIISNGDIEDFLFGVLGISEKTRNMMGSCLHDFFLWLNRREEIPIPKFPYIPFELQMREVTDLETQQAIISVVKEIAPFKAWLAIRWLSIHNHVRPGEMRDIKEKDIDRKTGIIIIRKPKEGTKNKIKVIHLDAEDRELLNRTMLGMPELYFFRHTADIAGKGRVKPESQYGINYLNNCWKKACKELGVKGVSLYAGTRHTSVTALRDSGHSPEEIKTFTGHSSDAFNRYFQHDYKTAKRVTLTLKDMQKTANQHQSDSNQHLINIKRGVSNN